jgi:hypothetical protein
MGEQKQAGKRGGFVLSQRSDREREFDSGGSIIVGE